VLQGRYKIDEELVEMEIRQLNGGVRVQVGRDLRHCKKLRMMLFWSSMPWRTGQESSCLTVADLNLFQDNVIASEQMVKAPKWLECGTERKRG
jgi:hypothetical protein